MHDWTGLIKDVKEYIVKYEFRKKKKKKQIKQKCY